MTVNLRLRNLLLLGSMAGTMGIALLVNSPTETVNTVDVVQSGPAIADGGDLTPTPTPTPDPDGTNGECQDVGCG